MSHPEPAPTPLPVIEEFEAGGALVGILIGSESDRERMDPAIEELNDRGISYELNVPSAHRPARRRRVRLDGGASRRAGHHRRSGHTPLSSAAASYTDLPVIGVPLTSSKSALGGLDAIAAIVQMPPGVPVAVRLPRRRAQRRDPSWPRSLRKAAGIPVRPGICCRRSNCHPH